MIDGNFQHARSDKLERHSLTVLQAAGSKDEAIKQMTDYAAGLSKALGSVESNAKQQASTGNLHGQ